MGLTDWIEKKGIGAAIKPFGAKITAGIDWLNASPGRKRTIALVCVGIASAFRAADKTEYAQSIESLNAILQGLTTTSDIASAIMGIWGVVHPFVASYQTKQIQAGNVLKDAQAATPQAQVLVMGLQAEAIASMKQAQQESVRVEAVAVKEAAK